MVYNCRPSTILGFFDNVKFFFFCGITLQDAAIRSNGIAIIACMLPMVINTKISPVLKCPVGTMYVW